MKTDMQEMISEPLFDTITLYPGYTHAAFFQMPVGTLMSADGKIHKGLDETNMYLGGRLPTPNRFLCHAIEVHVIAFPALFRDVNYAAIVGQVYLHGFLEFFIGSKIYHKQGPVGKFMESGGYKLENRLLIEPLQNFVITLNFRPSEIVREVKVAVYLQGDRMRNVA